MYAICLYLHKYMYKASLNARFEKGHNSHKMNQFFQKLIGVVGWCEGAVYLTSLGRPTDIGLQLGKACYPCSG